MGPWLSKRLSGGHYNIFSGRFSGNNVRILMLGLDSAGKTTILYKIKSKKDVQTIPTVGFNVETVSPAKGITFTVWDVGGQDKIRELWQYYYQSTEGLFFIVDSNDRERLVEARNELYNILDSEEMKEIPVVVIANKQDLPHAMTLAQVADGLALPTMTSRMWRIHGACATSGEGIVDSMEDMANLVKIKQSKDRQ